jgi:hypothetical protein
VRAGFEPARITGDLKAADSSEMKFWAWHYLLQLLRALVQALRGHPPPGVAQSREKCGATRNCIRFYPFAANLARRARLAQGEPGAGCVQMSTRVLNARVADCSGELRPGVVRLLFLASLPGFSLLDRHCCSVTFREPFPSCTIH